MSEKKLTTRIQQKADTDANWGKATNFVPLKGEYIYYSDLHRVKVGDGVTKVGELPFLADNNTTYNASDGIKLDGNTFKHTNAVAAKSSGFYKVSYDAQGHITGSTAVTKADITNLGVPGADTHQAIKTLNTNNSSGLSVNSGEAIAGSGTINLHKVSKTGSYNDLNNKPDLSAYVQKSGGSLSGVIQGGAIDVHPENGGTIIGYYTNDLAFLTKRGGSYLVTDTTTNTVLSNSASGDSMANMFDGSPSYAYYTVSAKTDVVVIMIKSPTAYSWTTTAGIGFGSVNWRAKNIKIEMGYSATNKGTAQSPDADIVWATRANVTEYGKGLYYCSASGPNASEGGISSSTWSYMRLTLTNFNTTGARIAQIFTINYGSSGMHNTFLGRGGGTVYGTINAQGLKVNDTGVALATPSNLTSTLGLGSHNTNITWGTVKAANGYTMRYGADQGGGGSFAIGEKGGQTSMQVDGDIYVHEGNDKLVSYADIKGGGATSVSTDTDGKIKISSTNTTYGIANSSSAGLVKSSTTGTASGRDYKVQVNSDGTMKVNVPWTDTNTDTHWMTHAYVGVKDQPSNAATSNGNTYLKVCDENTIRSQFNIKGVGATTVASDANGNITITSNDTHPAVVNNNPTLSWGGQSTVGTIGGTALTVTMPANPNSDTHWSSCLYVGAKGVAANKATSNGEAYLKLYENGALRSQFNIKGSGGTQVATDSNGGIVISSPATTNKDATLVWGSTVTLATVGSTNITAKLPDATVTMIDLR